MQLPHSYVLVLVLFAPLAFPSVERPDDSELMARIQALGDEDIQVRQKATRQMEAWAEAFPRFMLTAMAVAYVEQTDVEIVFRLEKLMEPLARTWVLNRPSGFIGIHREWEERNGNSGVVIVNVMNGHAAESVGLQVGDMILAVDGVPLCTFQQLDGFSEKIASLLPGMFVELRILRGNAQFDQLLQLGLRPKQFIRNREGDQEPFAAWLMKLKSRATDFDPTFPVGHFPMK